MTHIEGTTGRMSYEREPIIVAKTNDGKEITIDKAHLTATMFRAYLERILERDLTPESRENIMEALTRQEDEEI